MIISYLRQWFKPKYPTLNRVEISAEAILHNLEILQAEQPRAEIIPVLKANAYGHGLKEICQILNRSRVNMVAIDSFPEAQLVYRYFKGRVLLIGEMPVAAYGHLKWSRTDICVYNSSTLRALAALEVQARVHLFVNSGMNREGIKDLPTFWREHSDCWPKVTVQGLCSHLADAEGDGVYNQKQQELFFQDLEFLQQQHCHPVYVHLGNSAGVFALRDQRLTAFRPGLALYGYNPFSEAHPSYLRAQALRSALRLISTVVAVQDLSAGEIVSYNASFRATQATKIAVIPFGYYEGLDRRLSSLADFQLLVGNKKIRVHVAGKVCMNLCCLEINREEAVVVGAEVVLISPQVNDYNSLTNLASLQGSIPYELLVKLQSNIRRVII